MKIKELLTDSSKWTKGSLAKTETNCYVSPSHTQAVCWCLLGAIFRCYKETELEISAKIFKTLGINSITDWNDSPERTFDEVKALVLELDI